jgi:hypothetical protein
VINLYNLLAVLGCLFAVRLDHAIERSRIQTIDQVRLGITKDGAQGARFTKGTRTAIRHTLINQYRTIDGLNDFQE